MYNYEIVSQTCMVYEYMNLMNVDDYYMYAAIL